MPLKTASSDVRYWHDSDVEGWAEYVRSAQVFQTSTCSAIARASSTSMIFAVHLWRPAGQEPENIWQILNRQKDIQYSSRIASHITRQLQTHKLRHVITQLLEYVPEEVKRDPLVKELAGYSCKTRMHVVRLLAPRLDNESHTKDIDFSSAGICRRWETGFSDTTRALTQRPWIGEFGPLDAVVLHEPIPDSESLEQPSLEEVGTPQEHARTG